MSCSRKWYRCAVFLLVTAIIACGVIQRRDEVRQWLGRTETELRNERGVPTRTEKDSRGRKVLVYRWSWTRESQEEGRMWRDANGDVRWTEPRVVTSTVWEQQRFTVDTGGVIVDAVWPVM